MLTANFFLSDYTQPHWPHQEVSCFPAYLFIHLSDGILTGTQNYVGPREGGAWWAAICGVTQSQTRLERLSSSSSSILPSSALS